MLPLLFQIVLDAQSRSIQLAFAGAKRNEQQHSLSCGMTSSPKKLSHSSDANALCSLLGLTFISGFTIALDGDTQSVLPNPLNHKSSLVDQRQQF